MKRAVLYTILFIMCHIPIMAQDLSEEEVTQLMSNAFQENKEGNHKEALELFLNVGRNTRKQRTEAERQVYVRSQTMAVLCYELLSQFEKGFRLSEELLGGNINESERNDLEGLYVLNGYGIALKYMSGTVGLYKEARELLEKITPYATSDMLKRIKLQIPESWYLESLHLREAHLYKHALVCMQEALKGYHEIGATKDEIDALTHIGVTKKHLYDIEGTLSAYQQAYSLTTSIHDDSKTISILREQYKLCELLGNTQQSVAITAAMDSIIATTDNKELLFEYYNQQADVSKGHGDYELAEQWYKKNDLYINELGADYQGANKHQYYLNLGNLYINLKKYDDALTCFIKSKREFQKQFNETESSYYLPYMNVAYAYSLMGDSVRCFQNLDTLCRALGMTDEPREKRNIYTTRAICLAKFKHYEKALADYKMADKVMATQYGENDGERISLLSLMGGMEHQLGHYEESERLYKKYADGIKTLYGEEQLKYIEALGYQANAEAFAGHIQEACQDYTIAVGALKEQTMQKLPYLTSAEREGYWKQASELIQNMTPFALEAKEYQTTFTRACYDGLALSKAFLLETERSTYDIIKDNGTADDLHEFSVIASLHTKLKDFSRGGTEHTDSILALISEIRQRETQLAIRCQSYGDITSFMSVGYKEIKNRLNDSDVMIDFTDFVSKKRGRIYTAYLLKKSQDNPLLQELFAESRIDSMLVTYPDQYYESPHAETMYQLLWTPFKDKVPEGATVYYVPSQLLFQIALESLLMEDGTLLGDHYHFVRLSSARELLNFSHDLKMDLASTNKNAILYGGLLYDLEANEWEEEAKKYDVSSLLAVRGDVLRGDSVYKMLPGTKKEVNAIEQILKSKQLTFTTYTGKIGTEESFLNMNGHSPQILHIATHGFFYTPEEAQEIDFLRGYKDAMSLSGLVMSGGNAAWLGKELPKGVLGGILTASNIARLDLSNTTLTVLSACQSGRGQATAEGLYGLQRAFKKAGVKTMVMSLWNVSDVVCTEFMKHFYENLFDEDNHYDKRKAFEKAKLAIREKYSEPFYWAGFVMLD